MTASANHTETNALDFANRDAQRVKCDLNGRVALGSPGIHYGQVFIVKGARSEVVNSYGNAVKDLRKKVGGPGITEVAIQLTDDPKLARHKIVIKNA